MFYTYLIYKLIIYVFYKLRDNIYNLRKVLKFQNNIKYLWYKWKKVPSFHFISLPHLLALLKRDRDFGLCLNKHSLM